MTRSRIGRRRETLILLPAAVLLPALLSCFTLFSYRDSVRSVIEQRRAEAGRLARELAVVVEGSPTVTALELMARVPGALSVALLDAAGSPMDTSGDAPARTLLPDAVLESPGDTLGWGPEPENPERISAVAAVAKPRRSVRYVRLDLPAQGLDGQRRSVQLLGGIVLAVNGALLVLVLIFLRHLLAPWDAMVSRVRATRGVEEDEDEAALLMAALEEALADSATLSSGETSSQREEKDEVEVLQRMLTQDLESGLLLLDRRGRALSINPLGRTLLAVEEDDVVGWELQALLAHQPKLAALLRQAVAQQLGLQRQEVTLRTGAEERLLGLTVHLLRRNDGEVRGYLVLFADLTESRREARQARLAEGLAQLGEMAAGVAHELRNGLATVRGYLTLVERQPNEETLSDYLQEMRQETDHLQRVVEDFLLFSRPGSARPEPLDFEQVVRRTLADPALAGVAIDFVAEAATGERRLVGDAQLLEHALKNLLRNAWRAQEEAGVAESLKVRLKWPEGRVRLTIEDRGGGVPAEIRERLFQPFISGFRGGVGLGLAVAHRIVSLHGGQVSLEDRNGGGTRAVVDIPVEKYATKSSVSGSLPNGAYTRQKPEKPLDEMV
jgi:signal transduction histidine kinase